MTGEVPVTPSFSLAIYIDMKYNNSVCASLENYDQFLRRILKMAENVKDNKYTIEGDGSGFIQIADDVVSSIVGLACTEVEGVALPDLQEISLENLWQSLARTICQRA